MNYQQRGFTLIELSIVLVILGLIVGAIVGGQSLIKAAELQSVVRELNNIKVIMNAFRLQYDALPGDMPDAYDYWGGSSNTICGNDNTNGTGCNGNGDGKLGYAASSGTQEGIRAWRHLTLAELTEAVPVGTNFGCFRLGSGTPSCSMSAPNVMLTSYRGNSGYVFMHPEQHASNAVKQFYGFPGNFVVLTHGNGTPTSNLNSENLLGTTEGVLSPGDIKKIDLKLDDGFPTLGTIFANRAWTATLGNCTTPSYGANALDDITPSSSYLYEVSEPDPTCTLLMRLE